jgi:hypothetical protein
MPHTQKLNMSFLILNLENTTNWYRLIIFVHNCDLVLFMSLVLS